MRDVRCGVTNWKKYAKSHIPYRTSLILDPWCPYSSHKGDITEDEKSPG